MLKIACCWGLVEAPVLATDSDLGFPSQNWGYHFGGPNNKDYSIWGSVKQKLVANGSIPAPFASVHSNSGCSGSSARSVDKEIHMPDRLTPRIAPKTQKPLNAKP